VAALISAIAALCIANAAAQDGKPRANQPKPDQTVERPFGGPPNRAPEVGKRCSAAAVTCAIAPRRLGSKCSCVGESGQKIEGLVVE
jgi:hypothetical protein